ncbi:hypothetical protein Bca4012_102882 [Brassica carinata]
MNYIKPAAMIPVDTTVNESSFGPAPTEGRQSGGGRCAASSPDSDLEALSHNPAHGSFTPLAFQPSAMTNCANQRFLSHQVELLLRRWHQ